MTTSGVSDRPEPRGSQEPPPATAAELVATIRHLHRRLRRRLIEALDLVDLTYAQFEALEIVEDDDGHHAGSLAGHLGVSRQAARTLATRLEAAGLSAFGSWDGGVLPIMITPLGRERLAQARDHLHGFHQLVEDHLDPRTLTALVRALNAAEAAIRPPPWFR
ncbi:MAG TPA: MarR family winged helix-turn-helix transcriptional regulator [Actinomycetota bacterium]|nr:MarR family winged helix-turn-helix transcriptional regulator [Actinomycetota bacterium]